MYLYLSLLDIKLFIIIYLKRKSAIHLLHWLKYIKDQTVLLLSISVHNSLINEQKNTKLRENVHYERINWNLYYWGFENSFKMNNIEFSQKKLFMAERENINFFGKEIKWKVVIRMHYSQTEINILPKITLQPEFFLWCPSSLMLLVDFLKICIIIILSFMKYGQNNNKKKCKNAWNDLFIKISWSCVYFLKVIWYCRIKEKEETRKK